jgi:hypothetical protein
VALGLPEQPLPTTDVNEADMPPVDEHLPLAGIRVDAKLRPSPAGLVDAQHLHRVRLLGQHRPGVRAERVHHRRPRQAMITGCLGHRGAAITDRGACLRAQPAG